MDPVYAVILAGDNEDRKIREGRVIANKAFLPINEQKMVEYVLDCYQNIDCLSDIAVVGPSAPLQELNRNFTIIPQQGSMVSNVMAAAEHYKDGWLLLSSCDIPLVTPESIKDFLSKCQGADLFYPLVTKEDNERVFPGMQRTWVSLKDGEFTGGNVLLVRTDKVAIAAPAAGRFFAARKSPMQLASLIGFMTLLKLALKRLSIREVERKMEHILGLDCKALVSTYPELGTDVDKESDYNLISERIGIAR